MTTVSYVTDQIQTANFQNAVTLGAGVNAYVAQGVHISASGDAGVGIIGGGSTVIIAGDVFGDGEGIYMPGVDPTRILVTSTGSVASAAYGIFAFGNNSVIDNAGTIAGANVILAFGVSPDVHNVGSILGSYSGVSFGASTGTNLLTNDGVIDAFVAVVGSVASDYVFNTGLITGTVLLNGGADLFDSRGGMMQGSVYLGNGADTAFGGDGADSISGDGDNDRIRGKLGDDRLDGGLGKDTLTGGHDEDEFSFSTTLGSANVDQVTDFVHGEDTILLSSAIFAVLGPTVAKSEFLARDSGHAATRASHHLIYDEAKGTLWFDADGKGGAGPIKFAQLGTTSDHPTNLTYHDFAII